MKVCKVYCTYFGERRGVKSASPNNANESLEVFRNNIENDKRLDCGVDNMDIIVVNNESKTITNECITYLDSINNSTTPYGKIVVINRENKGGSLGAHSYAFDLFEDEYDYWFFSEDDITILYPKYFKYFIEEFNDSKLGFLALTKINNSNDTNLRHVSGGFGVSKKEILKEIKRKYGKLPYDEGKNITNYGGFGNSETYFTNCYIKMGYDIRIPNNTDYLPISDNWEFFPPHVVWQKERNFDLNKKFLYHIGK